MHIKTINPFKEGSLKQGGKYKQSENNYKTFDRKRF